jgi:hypothetical protein
MTIVQPMTPLQVPALTPPGFDPFEDDDEDDE